MLLPVHSDLCQIGGSYTQRNVVNWTLMKRPYAGQRDIAPSLAHERLARHARSVSNRLFLHYAEAIAR
jgi:hypothetical protein